MGNLVTRPQHTPKPIPIAFEVDESLALWLVKFARAATRRDGRTTTRVPIGSHTFTTDTFPAVHPWCGSAPQDDEFLRREEHRWRGEQMKPWRSDPDWTLRNLDALQIAWGGRTTPESDRKRYRAMSRGDDAPDDT